MNQPQDNFLKSANIIGARLCRDALWDSNRCNWLGASMEFINHTWTAAHRAFGPELYNGTGGIALFLARLYSVTNERLYRVTAEGAARQAISQLDTIIPSARIGFYSGMMGIAYVLIIVGETFGNQEFVDRAFEIVEVLMKDHPNTQGLDVISGSAGAIPVLLNLHQRYKNDFLVDLAIRHGEHLLNTANKNDYGWSWNTLFTSPEQKQRDLTGFSHGTAGIALALLEIYRETGQEKFHLAAEQGFQYERHWFSPQHQNWPDFRNFDHTTTSVSDGVSCALAWCHGAPGIGLSRLRAYQITKEKDYKEEAEISIKTTANALSQAPAAGQTNYSLCHGLAGNAELLIFASQVFGDMNNRSLANQVGLQGIELYQKNTAPWPCGVLGAGETPNLMLGVAGVGHFYLRLFDPDRIPPIVIVLPESC